MAYYSLWRTWSVPCARALVRRPHAMPPRAAARAPWRYSARARGTRRPPVRTSNYGAHLVLRASARPQQPVLCGELKVGLAAVEAADGDERGGAQLEARQRVVPPPAACSAAGERHTQRCDTREATEEVRRVQRGRGRAGERERCARAEVDLLHPLPLLLEEATPRPQRHRCRRRTHRARSDLVCQLVTLEGLSRPAAPLLALRTLLLLGELLLLKLTPTLLHGTVARASRAGRVGVGAASLWHLGFKPVNFAAAPRVTRLPPLSCSHDAGGPPPLESDQTRLPGARELPGGREQPWPCRGTDQPACAAGPAADHRSAAADPRPA
eukprot:scaffold18819_cov42-Phaeocystis_antarctica.AAC.2